MFKSYATLHFKGYLDFKTKYVKHKFNVKFKGYPGYLLVFYPAHSTFLYYAASVFFFF